MSKPPLLCAVAALVIISTVPSLGKDDWEARRFAAKLLLFLSLNKEEKCDS